MGRNAGFSTIESQDGGRAPGATTAKLRLTVPPRGGSPKATAWLRQTVPPRQESRTTTAWLRQIVPPQAGHSGIRSNRVELNRAWCCLLVSVIALGGGCEPRKTGDARVRAHFGRPGAAPGEFHYPRGIAVSPVDGCVFVVDKAARVQRFSADGKYETEWRMPEYKDGKPTGLYVDRYNRVWVPDTHYARVICYARDGGEQFRFGSRGEGPGQFIFPTCVLLDDEGCIYVGEYGGNDRINKFSPQREYLLSFADESSGEGWVDRPTEILMDERGMLWVSDGCNRRICRYDRDGKFLGASALGGDEPGAYCYPFGMAFEKSGTLLVADRGNSRILRIGRDGSQLGAWGSPGRNLGQLAQPWGVEVGVDGRIYCLDSWNYRVQVIEW